MLSTWGTNEIHIRVKSGGQMRGRIRSVKPEVHLDEGLWDLEESTGLPVFRAFVGLWNYADREGRFEWRPRALKTVILPYWDGDFSRVLDALATRGFIRKYACGTRVYGLVRAFKKHQVINNREDLSVLPPPPDSEELSDTSTRAARVDDASLTRAARVPHAGKAEGKGKEGNGKGTEGSAASEREPRAEHSTGHSTGLSGQPSAGHIQELLDVIRAEAMAAGFKSAPRPFPGDDRVAAQRAREMAAGQGVTYTEACEALAKAALRAHQGTGKGFGACLREVDPYSPQRPPGSQQGRRMPIAPATTAEDFADAEDVEVQMARYAELDRARAAKGRESP